MQKILILSLKTVSGISFQFLNTFYTISEAKSVREAVIQLIDASETILVIIEGGKDIEEVRNFFKKIHILNPLLDIIIISPESLPFSKDYLSENHIFHHKTFKEEAIRELLNQNSTNRRAFNRIRWPLNAKYFLAKSFFEFQNSNYFTGNIVSFSPGGAYVKTDNFSIIEENKPILMQIAFNDFEFFVECIIIRIQKEKSRNNPSGFSARFVNVSKATENLLKNIVNDRLAMDLLEGLEEVEEDNKQN